MAQKFSFKAKVDSAGKIERIFLKKFMDEEIKRNADGFIKITIEKWYKERTSKQNKFYFKCFLQDEIDCFKEFWGESYDKEEMHDWNKSQFWGEEKIIEETGEVVRLPGSSKGKSTIEWEDKLEDIRQWFRQRFNFEIRYPEQQAQIDFHE